MIRFIMLQIWILVSLGSYAQNANLSYLSPARTDSIEAGSLTAKISNNNFLKNNEYFNPYTEGITYFGSQIQPEISYAFNSRTRLSLGCFLRFYYGQEKFNATLPVFRFEYRFLPGMKITFGQFQGLLDHKLIEPIYSFDNYYKRNPENGIELSVNRKAIRSSLWISWDHFILPGENKKEEITSGLNTSWKAIMLSNKSFLSLNLQAIVHHYGGQVDASDSPLETRLNLAPGIEFTYLPSKFEKAQFTLASYIIQASDRSGKGMLPYTKGWASYSWLLLRYGPFCMTGGWFHGEYYFAPLGDHLFQSISELNNWYAMDNRNLLTYKILIDHKIARGVKFGIRFESYYDTDNQSFDYCYGMNIKADADCILYPLKKRK